MFNLHPNVEYKWYWWSIVTVLTEKRTSRHGGERDGWCSAIMSVFGSEERERDEGCWHLWEGRRLVVAGREGRRRKEGENEKKWVSRYKFWIKL